MELHSSSKHSRITGGIPQTRATTNWRIKSAATRSTSSWIRPCTRPTTACESSRKPAPIQVTMLGPPTTTGLGTMDYRLTDSYLDPPESGDGDYTERSIRLPHCFWCYPEPEATPEVSDLPALANGFVTFGCLNQFAKVTEPSLDLWIQILQRLPGSRLVVLSQPGHHREHVLRQVPRPWHRGIPRRVHRQGRRDSGTSPVIRISICASIRSPTTAIPAPWIRSGWACR